MSEDITKEDIKRGLEEARKSIEDESISYGEILFLQQNIESIEPDDIQLLQWAGGEERHKCYCCDKIVYGNGNVELDDDGTICFPCRDKEPEIVYECFIHRKSLKNYIIKYKGEEIEVITSYEYSEEFDTYSSDYKVIDKKGEEIYDAELDDVLHDFIQELE